jgi:hypothetical protein
MIIILKSLLIKIFTAIILLTVKNYIGLDLINESVDNIIIASPHEKDPEEELREIFLKAELVLEE